MSERQRGQFVIEQVYTRDEKIPLVAGDYGFDYGWRCVPLPPALDEGWEIFDESKDHKTGWLRVVWRPE